MRKTVVLTVLLVLTLAACNRSTVAGLQVTKTHSDSTVVLERLRVDTVTIPADTVEMIVKVNCDSAGKVAPLELKQKSTRAEAKALLTPDGVLKLVFSCKEYEAQINAKDSIIKRLENTSDSSHKTVVETKTVIPNWAWACVVFTACWVVWQIARLLFKYGKYFV